MLLRAIRKFSLTFHSGAQLARDGNRHERVGGGKGRGVEWQVRREEGSDDWLIRKFPLTFHSGAQLARDGNRHECVGGSVQHERGDAEIRAADRGPNL
jgi:hypothetical protein